MDSAFVTPIHALPSSSSCSSSSTCVSPAIRRRLPLHRIGPHEYHTSYSKTKCTTATSSLQGQQPLNMSRTVQRQVESQQQTQSNSNNSTNYNNTRTVNNYNDGHSHKLQDDQHWRKRNSSLVSEAQQNGIDSAIDMLWKLNKEGEAVTQNFNQVVSLLSSRGRFEDGLRLAEEAGKRGFANIITFRPLMKLCCSLGDGRSAKRVWKLMRDLNVEGDMFIYAELMGAVVRSQDMTAAYRIMTSLTESGLQPHIILFNTLMKEFARRADVHSGFEILKTIEKAGIKPDETTFNTLLNTCVRALDVDSLQQALVLMNKHNISPGTPTFNTILKLYSRKGKFDKALTIFEEMQQSVRPSIVTYNTLIDGCAHRGDMEKASLFFDTMINNGFAPDICTLTSLLKGFGRSNDPKRAVELFRAMKEGGYRIEERTRYAVINACLRSGDRVNAKHYLREMKQLNIPIRTKTWSWMVHSDVVADDENSALESLSLMYANGAYLDINRKAALIRESRDRGSMAQFLRQLKAAKTGETRN